MFAFKFLESIFQERVGPSPVQVSRPFPFKPEFVPFSAITQDGQLPTEDDTVRLSYLCSHCESTRSWMQDRIADPKAPWRVLCRLNHYDTTSQLEQSARAGCHLCTLLFKPHDLVEENLSGLEIFQFPTQSVATANYTRGPGSPYIRIGSMNTLSIISSQENTLANQVTQLPVTTTSRSLWGQIKSWIERCDKCHDCCSRPANSPPALPSRLVQLLSGKTDSDLRLIESNTLSHTPRYVTLSYCWGGTTAYKLEQLTMATMKSGFTSTILPKTLRDAITVTRELDISYIWIDSLCIIQDLPLDWEKEAREMGKVYSNSYLTIGALGAVSSTQGLFVQRDPLTCTPCWMFQGKDGTDFYVAPSGSCPLEKWYDEAPLHSRGWVMQERLLSPRTLNFGLFVVWECRKELLHELSPTKSCHEQHFKTGRIPKEAFHQKMGNFSDEHISLDFWSESVVYPYTQTKLTNASDRLVALDGMVKSFSQNTGWKNFWGLWEPFLVEQCLWKHEDMGQDMELLCDSTLTSCGSRNPGFPTWSWASLQSPVRYLEILPQMSPFFKAEIQAFSIPSRIDEGGPTTAVLVVSSALFPIKVVESVMEPLWQPRLMLTSSRSVIISRTQRQK